MAITLSNVFTNLNTYLGDSSTDRISDAERYQALTEATTWLQEELGNEHMVDSYEINYFDTIHSYKVTNQLADLLIGADLRREEGYHYQSFSRKSPREIAEEITLQQTGDPSWAVERKDGDAYLVINAEAIDVNRQAKLILDFNTVDNWEAENDSTNITLDEVEKRGGYNSLNFDIDVSADGSNYATITNGLVSEVDLTNFENTGYFLYDFYIPDATYTSSVTLFWGQSVTDTWFNTVSTDIDGASLRTGWNTIKIPWDGASTIGSPTATGIDYIGFRVTYTASQADDTDYRIGYLRIALPERLTFSYISWNVGQNSGGTDIVAYTAATDVPFYSGRYDQYKYAVAHKAASIIFYSALRLPEQGGVEEAEAIKSLRRYRKNFESSKVREIKTFKILGNNLRRGNRRRR